MPMIHDGDDHVTRLVVRRGKEGNGLKNGRVFAAALHMSLCHNMSLAPCGRV